MPNRLAQETSPYLLQHADNPVDWWGWNAEALAEAVARDKPILLSIGYSACHWCHVMAHESFEDADTAALMNQLFVNIKVDREERPDIDSVYMAAVQAMTGHGGWPMTMFLTPKGEPFYGGTYFPPDDRHGIPSFRRVMLSVAEAWKTKRGDVTRAVGQIGEIYAGATTPTQANGPVTAETLDKAFADISRRFEPSEGGFGGAPKFPQAMTLDFVLHHWARTGDTKAMHIVRHSYLKMARGGIFDQVGGGFHRYTVDARWLVPHFEKMLYDNALLARLGVHLWQATRDDEIRRTAEFTLDWVLREMTDASGGWYSALDADSEGEEGKFYVWSVAEFETLLTTALGKDDAATVLAYWGVTAGGNFEGHNILSVVGAPVDEAVLTRARAALYPVRAKRVWPGRDEKILASWNGLMLRAMCEGARVFGEARYREAALANGAFLWREMVRDGRVWRTHTRGETRIPGFLEDQAAVALGFMSLYELTFDRAWLDRAIALSETCVAQFWDDDVGAFFDTARDHEQLVTRPRDAMDNATPSGNSLAVELLLRVAEFTGDVNASRRASYVIDTMGEQLSRYATMFGQLLCAADMAVYGAVEIAIVGETLDADFVALTSAVAERYVPSLVMAGGRGAAAANLALLAARTRIDDLATAYVCRRYACESPTTEPSALTRQIERAVQR